MSIEVDKTLRKRKPFCRLGRRNSGGVVLLGSSNFEKVIRRLRRPGTLVTIEQLPPSAAVENGGYSSIEEIRIVEKPA